MTQYFWIRESGNGAYCVNTTLNDGSYNEETCILVPERPTPAHKWDNNEEEWTISVENQQNYIRPIRDVELTRTDKFVLQDYYDCFNEEEKAAIINYRHALRDVPNHETVEEIHMPDCPDFMKD